MLKIRGILFFFGINNQVCHYELEVDLQESFLSGCAPEAGSVVPNAA